MSPIELNLSTIKEDIACGLLDAPLSEYMKLRAIGRDSLAALTVAFGANHVMSGNSHILIDFIEGSDKYIEGMPAALERMKHVTIWSPAISARNLVAIANGAAKASDRMNAIKELNVIYGVTIIDENGKTKSGGMTLKDFWALKGESDAQTKTH